MISSDLVLIPGAGGVGRAVFEQLRTQDVPVRSQPACPTQTSNGKPSRE